MADLRIQYTEEMVGAGHATKADTLNRLILVEHNSDGTHKIPITEIVQSGDQTLTAANQVWEDATSLQVTLPSIGTYDIETWLRIDLVSNSTSGTGTADIYARLFNVTTNLAIVNSELMLERADSPATNLIIKADGTTYGKHSIVTTQPNEVIKVQVIELTLGGISLATKLIASNTAGRSKIRYTRIS